MGEADRAKVLEALPAISLAETKTQQRTILEDLQGKCEAGLDTLVRASSVLNFFLEALLSRDLLETDPPLWGADLFESGLLSEKDKPSFERLVEKLVKEIGPKVKPQARIRGATGGVFPVFAVCGYTVEVRCVREDFYRRDTPIDRFEPKVVDAAPILSFHFETDGGDAKNFYFQASKEDVDYLIRIFTAAQKELAAFEEFLGLPNQA